MRDLIKVDLRRVLKDKLFLVTCIIAAAFALLTPLLYQVLFGTMDQNVQVFQQMGLLRIDAQSQFFEAFSLGGNLGLVAPILLAIILYKDFTQGTVRNKIISGKSRTSIFFSMYTVCAAVIFGIVLLHAVATLLIALCFFPYSYGGEFGLSQLGYLLASLAMQVLLYLFMAAFVCWLCVSMKNIGVVIVLYVAISMVMSLLVSGLAIGREVLLSSGRTEAAEIIQFFQNINVFYQTTIVGRGDTYTTEQVLYYTLVPLAGTAALLARSVRVFKKKDLK